MTVEELLRDLEARKAALDWLIAEIRRIILSEAADELIAELAENAAGIEDDGERLRRLDAFCRRISR